jgi:hypothetical protein
VKKQWWTLAELTVSAPLKSRRLPVDGWRAGPRRRRSKIVLNSYNRKQEGRRYVPTMSQSGAVPAPLPCQATFALVVRSSRAVMGLAGPTPTRDADASTTGPMSGGRSGPLTQAGAQRR